MFQVPWPFKPNWGCPLFQLSYNLVFLNGPTPASFCLFSVSPTNNPIFKTNYCENNVLPIYYTVPVFEPTTYRLQVASYNHWTRASPFAKICLWRKLLKRPIICKSSIDWDTKMRRPLSKLIPGDRISVTRKKSPNVCKSCPKMISMVKWLIWHLYKNCLRMLEIWVN